MINIKPLSNFVFVKVAKTEPRTKSGIYIPEDDAVKPNTGIIAAIGDDVRSVQIGDTVLFKHYSLTDTEIDGEHYLVGPESDLLAVLS